MRFLPKIFLVVLIILLLGGAFLLAQRMTRQELTRIVNPATSEAVTLMWQPQLIRGNGLCYVDLLNAQGIRQDTAPLRTYETGFEALQQCGQIEFANNTVTVKSLRTGDLVKSFTVRDGHFKQDH